MTPDGCNSDRERMAGLIVCLCIALVAVLALAWAVWRLW